MRISIHVKLRSCGNKLIKNPDGGYEAFLVSAPVDGRANSELLNLLSEEFDVAKSAIKIIKGARSRNKVIEIAVAAH